MISTAASSRVSTTKSRASSAKLTTLSRWSATMDSSKPCSSASSKKTNAWAPNGDEKQEKVPPLVPSLFAHVPPTIYFFVEGEKGIFKMMLLFSSPLHQQFQSEILRTEFSIMFIIPKTLQQKIGKIVFL